jgi:hypothetical protein
MTAVVFLCFTVKVGEAKMPKPASFWGRQAEKQPQSYMERCSTQGDEKTTADPSFVGMTVLSVGQESVPPRIFRADPSSLRPSG